MTSANRMIPAHLTTMPKGNGESKRCLTGSSVAGQRDQSCARLSIGHYVVHDRGRGMLRIVHMALFAIGIWSAPLTAADAACSDSLGPGSTRVDASDPTAWARAWVPALERLALSIPALSPREEAWLQAERSSGNSDRWLRAEGSTEAYQQRAKRNADALLAFTRNVAAAPDRDQRARWLLLAQVALLETFSGGDIAVLLQRRVVRREAVPQSWVILAQNDRDLEATINSARAWTAHQIASCTLPAALGIQLSGQ